MKKIFTNTISIILLVFYLTGFCGLNLLKHSCFTCQQYDFHVIYDLDICGEEMHVCEAGSHLHRVQSQGETSHAHYAAIPCCTLELIYLKNNSKTLIQQVESSLSASSIDLYICAGFQLYNYINVSVEQRAYYLHKIIDPPEITQESLCCYRC